MPTIFFPVFFLLRLIVGTLLIVGCGRDPDWRVCLLGLWIGIGCLFKALEMEFDAQYAWKTKNETQR